MFIVDLTYIVPLEQIDAHMNDHMKFLRKYYKLNKFLASGRKVPRTGGIFLMMADTLDEVNEIISEDPFFQHKLAKFTITQFNTSQMHPALKDLLEK